MSPLENRGPSLQISCPQHMDLEWPFFWDLPPTFAPSSSKESSHGHGHRRKAVTAMVIGVAPSVNPPWAGSFPGGWFPPGIDHTPGFSATGVTICFDNRTCQNIYPSAGALAFGQTPQSTRVTARM